MSFYMSSDGLLDQRGGAKGFLFGKKRFKKLLMEIRQDTFEVQSDKVLKAFDDYKGDHERLDDVTVVGFGF